MPSIKIKFGVHLENYNLGDPVRHGPLFNRWLPDGSNDAIDIQTGEPATKLKLWFDRRGYVDTFIEFDYKRKEIDEEIMVRQAVLDAGPLMGLLKIDKLSIDILNPIQNNIIGDQKYVTFGKKVIKLIYPAISHFISIIRVNFGQYWLKQPTKWNSKTETLGQYCSLLSMKWSTDDGKTWFAFQPDEKQSGPIVVTTRDDHSDFLVTKLEWNRLQEIMASNYQPSLAATILARTHEYLAQEQLRSAFIEGVSGLELALNEFIKEKLRDSSTLMNSMSRFWQLPLKTQLVSVGSALGSISSEDLESTLSAIETRNNIVHEGYEPSENQKKQLLSLLKTVSMLLRGPGLKFPPAYSGNRLSEPPD